MQLIRFNIKNSAQIIEIDNTIFKSCALTIGNFDGLHLGHQAILANLKSIAKEHNMPAAVMLFEPHPKVHFAKGKGLDSHNRVLPIRDQLRYFKKYEIDIIYCIQFNEGFSKVNPEVFVKNLLIDKLKTKHLIVGKDFRFGHKGAGDFNLLSKLSNDNNFNLYQAKEVEVENKRVSSTWVRDALKTGDFKLAANLLGREYVLSGKIGYGAQLGRSIGFATINLKLPKNIALSGVFCVKVEFVDQDKMVNGVANVGFRPTVSKDKKRCLLEVHLLDFSEDVYGQKVKVYFYKKLRDEKKFSSLDNLKAQLSKDIKAGIDYF